jgi:ankyrin repeat protein
MPRSYKINSTKLYKYDKLVSCKDTYGFFNNIKGTCWMISIFMIILMNNETALQNLYNCDNIFKYLQINSNNDKPKYLKMLPDFFFVDDTKNKIKVKYVTLLTNFFNELKKRLFDKTKQQHKNTLHNNLHKHSKILKKLNINENTNTNESNLNNLKQNNNKKKRRLSFSSLYNINNKSNKNNQSHITSCETNITTFYNNIFNNINNGGDLYNSFNLQLLISIFLINDVYDFDNYYMNNPLTFNEKIYNFDNIMGIIINIPDHSMSFYKCKSDLMFCNNSLRLEFNWINLIKFINKQSHKFKDGSFILFYYGNNTFIIQNKLYYFIFDINGILKKLIDSNKIEIIKKKIKEKEILEIESLTFITKIESESYKESYIQEYFSYYLYSDTNINDKEYIKNKIQKIGKEDLNKFYKSPYNDTILMLAIRLDSKEIIDLILSKEDCDINATDKNKNTALMLAIRLENKKILELILSKDDCDVNIVNNDGNTALMLGIILENKEIVKLLLERDDCYVNIVNNDDNTALILALKENDTEEKYTEIIKLILAKEDCAINVLNKENDTALMLAIRSQNEQIVESILARKDCDVNIEDSDGVNAYFVAVASKNNLIIELINNKIKKSLKSKSKSKSKSISNT